MKKILTVIVLILVATALTAYFIQDNLKLISDTAASLSGGKTGSTVQDISNAVRREERRAAYDGFCNRAYDATEPQDSKTKAFDHNTDPLSGSDSGNYPEASNDANAVFPFSLMTEEIGFIVHDYYFSRELPDDVNPNDVAFSERLFTSTGELKDECCYFIVKASIKNLTGIQYEYLINSFYLKLAYEADDAVYTFGPMIEMLYFTQQGQASDNPMERYHYIFDPDEEIECTMIFAEIIERLDPYDLYIVVNNTGSVVYDENVRLHKVLADRSIFNG